MTAGAYKVDHVVGEGVDAGVLIIEPGETVGIVPWGDHPGFGIQGSFISSWGSILWQLSNPVSSLEYLTESTPAQNKKAAFKCPKKKLKAYKELFTKKGAPETCSFEPLP